jgi:hypothetical protein
MKQRKKGGAKWEGGRSYLFIVPSEKPWLWAVHRRNWSQDARTKEASETTHARPERHEESEYYWRGRRVEKQVRA